MKASILCRSIFERFDNFRGALQTVPKTIRMLCVLSLMTVSPVVSLAQNTYPCDLPEDAVLGLSTDSVVERLQNSSESSSFDVLRGAFTPHVIRKRRLEPVIFEATISGDPTSIALEIDGVEHPLRDDGTHGDVAAGDSTYTINLPAEQITSRLSESDVFRPFVGFLNARDGDTVVFRFNVFAEIWTPAIPLVSINRLAPDIQLSPHIFNIREEVGVTGEGFDPQSLSQEFYDWVNDDYDFIHFLLVPGFRANRYHASIQNSTQGLGLSDFDNSDDFGSAGRLQGYNVFPIPYFFDGANRGFIHEIGHQWVNYLRGTALESGIPHWPLSNLASGVMGFSLPGTGAGGTFPKRVEPEGNGYRVTGDPELRFPVFNDMELYLMGLLPQDEVGLIVVFNDQSEVPADGFYPNSAFTKVTIEDIVNVVGTREPGVDRAQKNFKVATIVVSDELLSPVEIAFYDYFAQRAEGQSPVLVTEGFAQGNGKPFYVATGQRAMLDVSLQVPVANAAPVVVKLIENIELMVGGEDFVEDLNAVFSDPDGDALKFSASSSDEAVASVTVDDAILTVSAVAPGAATITVTAEDGRGGSAGAAFSVNVPTPTSVTVEQLDNERPQDFTLYQNYPNPFNPLTTISFDLPQPSNVQLRVYDLLGREVAVLISGDYPAGSFKTTWDATGFPSGVYLYRIRADSYSATRKLILQK